MKDIFINWKGEFKQFFLISTAALLSTVLSVLYLDRPIALFMHNSGLDGLLQLRYITEDLPYIIAFIVLIIMVLNKNFTSWRQRITTIIYFYLSLYVTMWIKYLLKILFGRYWPKTWIHNNLSLINNNIYGFNFFHGSAMIGAFPSGHSAYTAFCIMWLIMLLPRSRIGFIVIGMMVPISLIILDYHFLGECLAGIFLGGIFAIISIALYNFLIRKNVVRA